MKIATQLRQIDTKIPLYWFGVVLQQTRDRGAPHKLLVTIVLPQTCLTAFFCFHTVHMITLDAPRYQNQNIPKIPVGAIYKLPLLLHTSSIYLQLKRHQRG